MAKKSEKISFFGKQYFLMIHTDLSYIQVKRWDSSQRSYVKISRPNCITKYNMNKHMGGFDSLDALVSVYRIDVIAKNSTGHIT